MEIIVLKKIHSSDTADDLIKLEIVELDVSTVIPIRDKVGEPISLAELITLIDEIKPFFGPEEQENYYFKVNAWIDTVLQSQPIPNYIGLRAILRQLYDKYRNTPNIYIQIG